MSVERKEFNAIAGSVAEYDNRSVVLQHMIIGKGVHSAFYRRVHRRSRARKQVETNVNGATFVADVWTRREKRRGVQQTRFILAANAHRYPSIAHCIKHATRKHWLGVFTFVATNERTGHAQVEHRTRF